MTKKEIQSLIEEAVRKVMREELREILVEAVGVVEEQKNVKPVQSLPGISLFSKEDTQIEDVGSDPYNIKAMLRETVLTAADRQTIGQVGTVEGMQPSIPQAPSYESVNSRLPDFSSFLGK